MSTNYKTYVYYMYNLRALNLCTNRIRGMINFILWWDNNEKLTTESFHSLHRILCIRSCSEWGPSEFCARPVGVSGPNRGSRDYVTVRTAFTAAAASVSARVSARRRDSSIAIGATARPSSGTIDSARTGEFLHVETVKIRTICSSPITFAITCRWII